MLVLTRRENDQISFPSLGITIEVTRMTGSRVSLAINAAPHIRIVRSELLGDEELQQLEAVRSAPSGASSRHAIRNQVNIAVLQLNLAKKLLENGEFETAIQRLSDGLQALSDIERTQASSQDAVVGKDLESHLNVLVVDDNENERVLMSSYLTECGFTASQASDGLEALYRLAEQPRPDVILLDMKMPNMDGPRTINRIRNSQNYAEIPIFAVSGQTKSESGMSAAESESIQWFQKPVNAEKLVSAIREVGVAR